MADDPIDAFDKLADDIRRKQDELDAADKLRSDKPGAAKAKPGHPPAADAGPEPPE